MRRVRRKTSSTLAPFTAARRKASWSGGGAAAEEPWAAVRATSTAQGSARMFPPRGGRPRRPRGYSTRNATRRSVRRFVARSVAITTSS